MTAVDSLARYVNRSRKVFFVILYYDEDCLTPVRGEFVVASRRQAKKAIHHIRSRCLEFHGVRIDAAWQRDLRFTGWTVNRRGTAYTRFKGCPPAPACSKTSRKRRWRTGLR